MANQEKQEFPNRVDSGEEAGIEDIKLSAREQWSNKIELVLSAIGYAIGMGNLWRFPYLAYTNGGGSFLIPYLIMLLFAGLPMIFMEMCLGQYFRQGPMRVYSMMAPAFKGLGLAMLVCCLFIAVYYNVMMAWVLFYIYYVFRSDMPWLNCTHMSSANCGYTGPDVVVPAEDFFNHVMLGVDSDTSWDNYGTLNWGLALCLLCAWILICLCLFKGIKTSGKVVYVTATVPYILLIIFLICGLQLDGAIDGLKFFITPDFEKLKDLNVWRAAASQIFFSLGPCFGVISTLSSYSSYCTISCRIPHVEV